MSPLGLVLVVILVLVLLGGLGGGSYAPWWGYGYGYGQLWRWRRRWWFLIILADLCCSPASSRAFHVHGVACWAEMRHNPQPMGRKN